MPCDDIGEVIEVSFDRAERLQYYHLQKATCGAAVGERELLLPLVRGCDVEELLGMGGADVRTLSCFREAHAFLFYKHLVALQSTVAALVGQTPATSTSECALISVVYDETLTAVARVAVSGMTEAIRACGRCGRCVRSKTAELVQLPQDG